MAELTRRNLIAGAGALGAGMILASTHVAEAQQQAHNHHPPLGAAKGPKHQKLMAAAMECINVGSVCRNHCITSLGMGDMTLKACLQVVLTMLPLCDALGHLASLDSPLLPNLAKVCIEACEACEKECRKHEKHHWECRICADACARCIKECKALLA